jgi:hypothetical protein
MHPILPEALATFGVLALGRRGDALGAGVCWCFLFWTLLLVWTT